jgi:hypothetical protein
MKRLRLTAFMALLVVSLVTAAPALFAAGGPVVSHRVEQPDLGAWVADWMARVVEWLGWGQEEPVSVAAAAKGDKSPSPPPEPEADCGVVIDPGGTPCR